MESSLIIDKNGRFHNNNDICRPSDVKEFWEMCCEKGEQTFKLFEIRKPDVKGKIILTNKIGIQNVGDIVEKLRNIIKRNNTSVTDLDLFCCVSTNDLSDNYRFYFPYYRCDLNKIYDLSVSFENIGLVQIKKKVPIYGNDDYLVINCYNQDEEINKEKFVESFCISNHPDFSRDGIDYQYEISDHIFPLLLSLSYKMQCQQTDTEEPIKQNYTSDSDKFFISLLDAIPSKIMRRYNIWLDIGMIIRNKYDYSDFGLELWKSVTNRIIKDREIATYLDIENTGYNIEKLYEREEKSNLTIKTLAWMARQYNKDEYDKLKEHGK